MIFFGAESQNNLQFIFGNN